jgi:hypothetical protein
VIHVYSFLAIQTIKQITTEVPSNPYPISLNLEGGVKFYCRQFTGRGLCRSGHSHGSWFRFLFLQRRKQPLLHDNAAIGFHITKGEPHSSAGWAYTTVALASKYSSALKIFTKTDVFGLNGAGVST